MLMALGLEGITSGEQTLEVFLLIVGVLMTVIATLALAKLNGVAASLTDLSRRVGVLEVKDAGADARETATAVMMTRMDAKLSKLCEVMALIQRNQEKDNQRLKHLEAEVDALMEGK